MREAKVTCICAEIRLKDLNLTLREGQTIWVSPERAKLSKDLDHARRIGAVSIIWKERARVTKPPPPPNFRRLSPGQRRPVRPAKKPAAPSPIVIQTQIDADLLAKHVKAAVAGEVAAAMKGIKDGVGEQIEAIRGDLAAQVAAAMASQGQQIDQEALAATLAAVIKENMPKTVQGAPGAPRGEADGSTPLYIPSGIVDSKVEGRVEVKETTDEAEGATDAAAKLKALRKRNRT